MKRNTTSTTMFVVLAGCTIGLCWGEVSGIAQTACNRPAPDQVKAGIEYTDCTGAKVMGTRPDPTACSASGQKDCLAAGAYFAFTPDYIASKILSGESVGGVAGTAAPLCASAGQTGCRTNPTWPAAAAPTSGPTIDPYQIRAGTSIGGVTGKLKYCRNGANITARDLDATESNTANGATYTVSIDATTDIITGVTDKHIPFSGLRVRLTSTGALPPEINSTTDYFAIYETNTSVKLATSLNAAVAGTAINFSDPGSGTISMEVRGDGVVTDIDTIDDRNLIGSVGGLTFGGNLLQSPFGSEYLCSHDDWMPLSTSPDGMALVPGTTSDCDQTSDDCMLMDKMTRVIWTKRIPGGTSGLTYGGAQKSCLDLTYGGYSDWRLPDQNELIQAFIDAIGAIDTVYAGFGTTDELIWSSTSRSNVLIEYMGTVNAWRYNLYGGAADYSSKTSTAFSYRCVRDAI